MSPTRGLFGCWRPSSGAVRGRPSLRLGGSLPPAPSAGVSPGRRVIALGSVHPRRTLGFSVPAARPGCSPFPACHPPGHPPWHPHKSNRSRGGPGQAGFARPVRHRHANSSGRAGPGTVVCQHPITLRSVAPAVFGQRASAGATERVVIVRWRTVPGPARPQRPVAPHTAAGPAAGLPPLHPRDWAPLAAGRSPRGPAAGGVPAGRNPGERPGLLTAPAVTPPALPAPTFGPAILSTAKGPAQLPLLLLRAAGRGLSTST